MPRLLVKVVAAKGMRKADILTENDPYCILYVYEGLNYEKVREKNFQITTVKDNCKNPEWNEDFEFEIKDEPSKYTLCIEMYDLDGQKPNTNKDDFLGLIQFKVSDIFSTWKTDPRKLYDRIIKLQPGINKESKDWPGEICISLHWEL